jgi:hypothetical protein
MPIHPQHEKCEYMHFVGIKCETCSEITNCNDPIDNLPKGWIALVQYCGFKLFSSARNESLHFCSIQHLYDWTDKQRVQPVAEESVNV